MHSAFWWWFLDAARGPSSLEINRTTYSRTEAIHVDKVISPIPVQCIQSQCSLPHSLPQFWKILISPWGKNQQFAEALALLIGWDLSTSTSSMRLWDNCESWSFSSYVPIKMSPMYLRRMCTSFSYFPALRKCSKLFFVKNQGILTDWTYTLME